MITKAIDSSKIDVVGEYEELKSEVSTLKAEIIQLEEKKKKQKKKIEKLEKLLILHNIPF